MPKAVWCWPTRSPKPTAKRRICCIDIATLTGAARVATGMELPPFFTDDETLAADLMRHATETHDPMWRLPCGAAMSRRWQAPSPISPTRPIIAYAGAITAALFLNRFVDQGEDLGAFRHRRLGRPSASRPPPRRRSHRRARDLRAAEGKICDWRIANRGLTSKDATEILSRVRDVRASSIRRRDIHDVVRLLAALECGDAVEHELHRDGGLGDRRDVRRHRDLGMAPQRAVLRQRLGLEDVEHRAGQMARCRAPRSDRLRSDVRRAPH